MQLNNGWTRQHYALFRVLLGVYLFQHFVCLLPWGGELFSSAGVLPSAALSPLILFFPNIFLLWNSPLFVTCGLLGAAAASILFVLGKRDRVLAVLLWYFWACLFSRNPLIGNPSLPFIGWLLLAHALLPPGSWPQDYREADRASPIFSQLYLAAWILLSLSYTYSGITKLVSPSWVDGSALSHILANPLARETALRTLLLSLPAWLLRTISWSALALELSFAPLALFRKIRPLIWSAMVCLHLTLLILINFADLTIGMLLVHFFTFDPAWLSAKWPAAFLGRGRALSQYVKNVA